jgi:hypothetical protein
MGRIGTAFRAFFVALFSGERAEQIRQVLDTSVLPELTIEAKRQPASAVAKAPTTIAQTPSKRSDAITLMATLQREARLVDLILEPLDDYSDEQVGAAARSVLKDSAAVLRRLFSFRPVREGTEGTEIEVPSGYDPARWRLTGKAEGNGPFRGRLAHKGWQATTVNLPVWIGSNDGALVVAPAEVEVQ